MTELQERLVALVSQEPEFGTVGYTHHALRVRVVQDMLQEAGFQQPAPGATGQGTPASWPEGGGGVTVEILPGASDNTPNRKH